MTQEDYVSYETAQLLREKGFDGECMSMYVTPKPHSGMGNPNEAKIAPHGRDGHYYDGYLYQCEAPTLQMARKWLRKVYNIHIGVNITYSENPEKFPPKYFVYISNTKTGHTLIKPGCCLAWKDLTPKGFDSPEEACEAAIKYCLENLI